MTNASIDASAERFPLYGRFKTRFEAANIPENPIYELGVWAELRSPTGREVIREAFWDGGSQYGLRFMPDEEGEWSYTLRSSPPDAALDGQTGTFVCEGRIDEPVLRRRGPLRKSDNGRYLVHADGTPFFWLADTAWNGALMSTGDEWDYYLNRRRGQGFSAVQFVATQWRSAPEGDRDGRLAYEPGYFMRIDPAFFQRMDRKIDAINAHGLLAVPVMLWANPGRAYQDTNPGYALPEDQAILLARYMVARWGAHHVAWILPGDGDYEGAKAEKWKRIGRAVFDDGPHAPVLIHPRGLAFYDREFGGERWVDVLGYQSGHRGDPDALRWLFEGPPATRWSKLEDKVVMNLEPCYENHFGRDIGRPFDAHDVRRAMWWSVLVSPTAGVTYGGHGVWGWDDGSAEPMDHPGSGVPLPWKEALDMPGAVGAGYLHRFFSPLPWWRLRPRPDLVRSQPEDPAHHIAAAATDEGDLAVVYGPTRMESSGLDLSSVRSDLTARWFDPKSGEYVGSSFQARGDEGPTPPQSLDEDWVLVLG